MQLSQTKLSTDVVGECYCYLLCGLIMKFIRHKGMINGKQYNTIQFNREQKVDKFMLIRYDTIVCNVQ